MGGRGPGTPENPFFDPRDPRKTQNLAKTAIFHPQKRAIFLGSKTPNFPKFAFFGVKNRNFAKFCIFWAPDPIFRPPNPVLDPKTGHFWGVPENPFDAEYGQKMAFFGPLFGGPGGGSPGGVPGGVRGGVRGTPKKGGVDPPLGTPPKTPFFARIRHQTGCQKVQKWPTFDPKNGPKTVKFAKI